MEKKKQVLKLLEECIALETKAIPLFTRHLETPDFFEEVPTQDRDRIKYSLQSLADDAQSHKGIFELLLARLKDTSENDH